MNPIEDLLNKMVTAMLPVINTGIQNAIIGGNLDPWGQVANGNDNFGSIDLGICDASANGHYNVNNMRGLSSITIDSFVLSSLGEHPDNSNELHGIVNLSAFLARDLSANAGGDIEAKCGFLHPSVGISGSANVSGAVARASGSFTASINSGSVCLNSVTISDLRVSYSGVNIDIDGLGIFNFVLRPLIDAISSLFRGPITDAIGGALRPVLNDQINKVMPLCQPLLNKTIE